MSVFDDIKESVENYILQLTRNYKKSSRWFRYNLGYAIIHCLDCLEKANKIFEISNKPEIPIHPSCRCYYLPLQAVNIGEATKLGEEGADYYLKHYRKLPDYYITKKEAKKLGWRSYKGNLDQVAPGKMIGGDIYYNKPPYLPEKEGRIWYECDVDYQGGYRNNYRIVYSNDGLMFLTDSHYLNFIAIE